MDGHTYIPTDVHTDGRTDIEADISMRQGIKK